ncbi:protein SGT1 homolog [Limulus polyphemus]|uniref:Protein SGT1 homolog n=1 Tax=Limulus polyphemus TaxID=6850 RepID=A0ABM1SAZ8_LIMPO|nr:protein SGT1 homolog [Limulus polyphemus]XP_013773625.1 protein SGT1 homolog [Limulus polyphemus]XP_022240798.1 protein SGT1 homolog [Limulus polyphemus]XP_022240803.1 protein SGT1 homolog [Limulus polyphemus]
MSSKGRYEWYQTESHVVITILLKNLKDDDVKIVFLPEDLSCSIKLPGGTDYNLELELSHEIVPSKSSWKLLPSKIEIKMKKAEGIRWTALEKTEETRKLKQIPQDHSASAGPPTVYPSSAQHQKDWDKLVLDIKKEEETEKPEGEAALNELFQKIYAEGSDEVKKAMNKSFMESGGTVLSTNWQEVGSKHVEVKPPDGMEWKKWE